MGSTGGGAKLWPGKHQCGKRVALLALDAVCNVDAAWMRVPHNFFFLGVNPTRLFAMSSNLGGGIEKKGYKRILRVLLKAASKVRF